MPNSQNGWSANDIRVTSVQTVPGTTRKIRLRTGDVGYLLTRIAAFIDHNVEDIEGGVFDDWGYAERVIRDGVELSNHASGTAADINATQHPLAVTGTWSAAEKAAIHTHLRDYIDPATGHNVIRWGEDYVNRKDGMHFEIVANAAAVSRVATKLRGQHATPPPSTPPVDVTINRWSIQFGAGKIAGREGAPMRTADATWLDIRAFMAWARALGYITKVHELAWVNKTSNASWINFPGANVLALQAVQCVQRANHLTADGVFGAQTGAVMARYGYKIV